MAQQAVMVVSRGRRRLFPPGTPYATIQAWRKSVPKKEEVSPTELASIDAYIERRYQEVSDVVAELTHLMQWRVATARRT